MVLIPSVSFECQFQGPGCDPDADTVVRVHETDFLGFVTQYQLPSFPLSGNNVAVAHGRFIFTTPGLETLAAIVQADPSSGALHDFALVTMMP